MNRVLVTGSSMGIGFAVAEEYAKHGYDVVLNCSKSIAEARKKAKYLKENYGVRAFAVKADISKEKEVEKLFTLIEESLGGIDVLVNNAGTAYSGLIQDMSYEEWKRIFDVNIHGTFLCSRACLKGMIHNKAGSIINISSIWGQTGSSCEVAYSASKAAVIGFTKALAKEVAPSGIRVNCIAPGLIDTRMNNSFTKEEIDSFIEEIPLNRMGSTKDISSMAYFLSTDECAYITGQVIGINGGVVC